MEKIVWALQIIASIVGVLITREFFRGFLSEREKVSKWLEYVLWGSNFAGGIVIARAGFYQGLDGIILLGNWLIIVLLLYEGRAKKKLLVVLCYFVSSIITKWLMVVWMKNLGMLNLDMYIFCWALGKMSAIFILQIIKGIHKKSVEGSCGKSYWITNIMISGGTVFMTVNLYLLTCSAEGEYAVFYASSSVLVLLILNGVCFAMYGTLREKEELVEEQSFVHEQQMVLFNVRNEETEETWNELKKFRHDYANHLICVREHLRKNGTEEALKYVNGLLNSFKGEYGTSKISNSFVDTFLGYKIRNVNKDNIRFQTDIVIPRELPFDEADLCIILGNAFDNAVDAVRNIPENGREIYIAISYRRHTLKLIFENPYNGVIKKDRKGRLQTTKEDSSSHGIGISSMEKTVKKYNGLLDSSYTMERFRLKVLLYEK